MKSHNLRSGFNIPEMRLVIIIICIITAIAIPNLLSIRSEVIAHGTFGNVDGVLQALKDGALGEEIKQRANSRDGFVFTRIEIEELQEAVYTMSDSIGACSIIIDADTFHILCMDSATNFELEEQATKQILRYTYNNTQGNYILGEGVQVNEPAALPAVKKQSAPTKKDKN